MITCPNCNTNLEEDTDIIGYSLWTCPNPQCEKSFNFYRIPKKHNPDKCPLGGLHVYKWDGMLPTDEMIKCEKCGHSK